ncbi:DUF389 domain-containing protein [Ornithinimicrobium sp. Arc0846-15]|nr:DUF389 domain-containing protein [Ornithinimicrobium laminariae]
MDILGTVTKNDIDRITGNLFMTGGSDSTNFLDFTGAAHRRNVINFWVLLILAGVIASVGVVADATATVIGAMIVAPLMTPILGTALALVLVKKEALKRCLYLVIGGAVAVIAVGFLLGLIIQGEVSAATNSQVSGRVSPKLIDLVGAIATGLVGAYALTRKEVSDTLPGVAIAISLVPPLAVVGLTLESGQFGESMGALILFGMNVSAIIATGTLVMLASGLRQAVRDSDYELGEFRGVTLVLVIAILALYTIPLGYGSYQVAREQYVIAETRAVTEEWAEDRNWAISDVSVFQNTLTVTAVGRPPELDAEELRAEVERANVAGLDIKVNLIIGGTIDLPATNP